VVYEPTLELEKVFKVRVIKDLDEFKRISEVIIANRLSDEIEDVKSKVITRDIFYSD